MNLFNLKCLVYFLKKTTHFFHCYFRQNYKHLIKKRLIAKYQFSKEFSHLNSLAYDTLFVNIGHILFSKKITKIGNLMFLENIKWKVLTFLFCVLHFDIQKKINIIIQQFRTHNIKPKWYKYSQYKGLKMQFI